LIGGVGALPSEVDPIFEAAPPATAPLGEILTLKQVAEYLKCHHNQGVRKTPGIKIHDTRMLRLMEVLLHTATKVLGWRTAEIHQAILSSFSLAPANYTLTQLRYDLRKLKAHGLLERDGRLVRENPSAKPCPGSCMPTLT
jgi:hypothetical protein